MRCASSTTAALTGVGTPSRAPSATHRAVEVVDLTVSAFRPVLEHRRGGVGYHESGVEPVQQGVDDRVGLGDIVGAQPEDRQQRISQSRPHIPSLAPRAHHQLAHAGVVDRLQHRQPDDRGRDQHGAVADQLHPLGGPDVVHDRDRAGMTQQVGDVIAPAVRRGIDAADREPRALRRDVTLHPAGVVHGRGDLDDGAHGAVGADHVRDDVGRHPVLDARDDPVGGEMRRDQLGRPSRVVGLHEHQHDVELLSQSGHLAQMHRARVDVQARLRHVDRQPVRAHRLDVGRPLLDQRHVDSGGGQVRADRRSIGTGAEHGDLLRGHEQIEAQMNNGLTLGLENSGLDRPGTLRCKVSLKFSTRRIPQMADATTPEARRLPDGSPGRVPQRDRYHRRQSRRDPERRCARHR